MTKLYKTPTMKKLLLVLLLFTGMVKAQIVNIPDANFKAKLLSASPTTQLAKNFSDQWIKIDANNDLEIQQSEASAVKYLFIGGNGIIDTTGLNNFGNLEELDVNFIQAISLDLNPLINLKKLSLQTLFSLNNLNISNLINLTYV